MQPTLAVIFIFTGTDINLINNQVISSFPSAEFTSLPSWSLSHSSYRSTPDPSNPKSNSDNKHLHLLQISSIPSQTVLCTTNENEPTTAIAIHQGAATSDFSRLLKDKLNILWQPLKLGELHVSNGASWEVGMFRIHIGDLLRDRGAASGGIESRGTIVAVTLLRDEDVKQTTQQGKEMLQEFCQDVGLLGTSSTLKLLVQSWGDFLDWKSEAGLWCDILKKIVLGSGARAPRPSDSGT